MSDLDLLRAVGADEGNDAELARARSHAQDRLRAAIAREHQRMGPLARARRSLRLRPSLLAGAAAAIVAVVAAAVALPALRPPAATARLDRLAVVAEGAQQPVPTAEGFVYTRSRAELLVQDVGPDGMAITFVAHQRIERWLDSAGLLRVRTVYGAPTFPSPEDRAAFEAAGLDGSYGEGVVEDGVFEPAQLPETARAWSTDPETLRKEMLAELVAGGDRDVPRPARMLELGAALLQAPGTRADLRAAVLRVLAGEDGVQTAAATTASGAPAVEAKVSYKRDGIGYERRLTFDAGTAQLVEQSLVALDELPGGLPPGTMLRRIVNEPSLQVPSLQAPPTSG